MAKTKPGGYYIGTDGKPHDANGNAIEADLSEDLFTSGAAYDLAKEEGLTAADFEGVEESGSNGGYTKADVQDVASGKDEE